jgi:hypothetical protein
MERIIRQFAQARGQATERALGHPEKRLVCLTDRLAGSQAAGATHLPADYLAAAAELAHHSARPGGHISFAPFKYFVFCPE